MPRSTAGSHENIGTRSCPAVDASGPIRLQVVSRRDVIVSGTAAAVLMGWLGDLRAFAQDNGRRKLTPAEEMIGKLLGEAKPIVGKLMLELPEIAENGNTVPFQLSVESPMTDADYIKAIHIISTENPQPGVATFTFTPLAGRASVASRMRLAKSQEVVAIAENSNGSLLIARRTVKVTIGGCGG